MNLVQKHNTDQIEIFFFNTIGAPEHEQKVYNEQAKNLESKILLWFKANPEAELTPLEVKDQMETLYGKLHESSVRRAVNNLKSEKWNKRLIGVGKQKLERYGKVNELIKLRG